MYMFELNMRDKILIKETAIQEEALVNLLLISQERDDPKPWIRYEAAEQSGTLCFSGRELDETHVNAGILASILENMEVRVQSM